MKVFVSNPSISSKVENYSAFSFQDVFSSALELKREGIKKISIFQRDLGGVLRY